ncbi:hypothetical protein AAC387_Pa12g1246 [Persea americana]
MESQSPSSRRQRTRILYTWGAFLLIIAHKAYKRAEKTHCPMGSLAHRLASLAGPIVYTIQSQLLTILSLADDQILYIEDMIEALFPPSAYVFNKIDSLATASETLPRKLDTILDQCPTMIHQMPALDWALIHFGETLNFLVVVLTDWAYDGAREVREITIHVNCNESTNAAELEEYQSDPNGGPDVKRPRPIGNSLDSIYYTSKIVGCIDDHNDDDDLTSYEEIMSVSKDMNEDDEKRVLHVNDEAQTHLKREVVDNTEDSEEEPILELFNAGWHTRPL